MIRRLMIRGLLLLLAGCAARAQTFSISAGASVSSINSTLATAAGTSGNVTVNFAAGVYNVNSTVTVPCPAGTLTIQGPVVAYRAPASLLPGSYSYSTPYTANLNGSLGSGSGWTVGANGCTHAITIQYFNWDGGHPSGGGGGWLNVVGGTSNLTVQNNYAHGNWASTSTAHDYDDLVALEGVGLSQTPIDSNVKILWNVFGDGTSDCNPLMNLTTYQGGAYSSAGGYCGAIGSHVSTTNLVIQNNDFEHLEQPVKLFEGSGTAGDIVHTYMLNNALVDSNDFGQYHRIGLEAQQSVVQNNSTGSVFNATNNSQHDPINPNFGQFGLSIPMCCTTYNGYSTGDNQVNCNSNVQIANVQPNVAGNAFLAYANEWWSTGACSNNLMQGWWSLYGTGAAHNGAGDIGYGFTSTAVRTWSASNNICQFSSSNGSCINNEEGSGPAPTQTGNTSSSSISARASVAPTISPSPGAYASPLTVTLTDPGYTSGAGPQGNTSIYYTTDGSTPNPGGASTAAQYYLSPSGSDSNSGTLASPWLTPNHAVNCGDTVTAIAGTYSSSNFNNGDWGTVTCSGGNNVAWLKCASFDGCKISSTTGTAPGLWIDKSYWGVQGFEVSVTANVSFGACFEAGSAITGNVVHHVVFANNVANGCAHGGFITFNQGTTGGADYVAIVGNIAYNTSGGSSACSSGISIYQPIASDTNLGTHFYIAGNFAWANVNPATCGGTPSTDGEAVIIDTLDFSQGGGTPYTQQVAVENNIGFFNGGRGFEVFENQAGSTHAPVYVYHNTSFGDMTDPNQTNGCLGRGELGLLLTKNTQYDHNLAQTRAGTSCSAAALYALFVETCDATCSVTNNWLYSAAGNNSGIDNSAGFSLGAGNVQGTNPSFTSPVNPGAPSCGTFASVPACMAAVVTDYTPTASGASAYGYQKPVSTPVTDALFPTWLCNVGLPSGLVSTPCVAGNSTQLYTVPIIVSLPATVTAVGMWGALNQPKSYPSGYGFVPSTVTTASYSASGGVTLSSVSIASTGGVTTLSIGATVQMIVTCHYSDGSTSGCNTTDSHGSSVTSWASSTASVTISSTGLATGAGVGTSLITAAVTGGLTTSPGVTLTVTGTALTLSSVSLATAGGVSSINAGTTNQLLDTCHYSDGSTSSCNSMDSHGNAVSAYNSSAPAIATVTSSGVVTGVAGGSTNLTGTVNPAPSILGTSLENVTGFTNNGFINEIYGVTGTSPGNYAPGNCHIIIPPTTNWTAGKLWTCLLVLGTPTTQSAAALCSNTYTMTGTSWPGGDIVISMASCPALQPDQGYWVGSTTNQTSANPAQGFSNCNSSCSGASPVFGSGTYAYRYVTNTFGNYTNLPTTLNASGSPGQQISQYVELTTTPVTSANLPLSITTPPPSLVSAHLTASSNSMIVGTTLQMAAKCHYSSGPDQDCTVADVYGDAVSAWLTSDPSKATVNNVGATNPGLVTAVAPGTPSITATIGAGTTSSPYPITVNSPAVTLTGVSLSLTGGVTGLFVGATNQLKATCTYSNGSSDDCTATDVHGNLAHTYASTTPAHATVNATSGLVTGVAPGATTFTAVAGSFTSNALPLNVFPVLSGVYTITVSGAVKFSGTVRF